MDSVVDEEKICHDMEIWAIKFSTTYLQNSAQVQMEEEEK